MNSFRAFSLRLYGLVVVSLCVAAAPAVGVQFRAYVGTSTGRGSISQGIYTFLFDSETGKLSEPELAIELASPSFLAVHPSGKFLYAVNARSEGPDPKSGGTTAMKINADGTLTKLNEQPSFGGACHCNVDATGHTFLIANYTGGNVVAYPIGTDGKLGEATCNIHHEDPTREDAAELRPRAHSINLSSDNRFAYAADLGLDMIFIYELDAEHSTLSPADPPSVSVARGGGPRHFAIHPSGNFAYTNNETSLVATAFSRNAQTGALTVIQDITTIPHGHEGSKSTAECLCHPSGRFLYISNRGPDSITVYSINQETGLLSWVENEPTGGKAPRNFFIEPGGKWLLAENQDSDSVVVFEIDQETGSLSPSGDSIKVGKPVCIRMVPAE
ncbi:MAG TPA: lactonase family protein [Planctomycetaceae bacterium]|nr:lactonase family protein [Planctomycetaceae bacterium]HQZ66472.1 lactonase family protein [Planctomycetaceae bacterium]